MALSKKLIAALRASATLGALISGLAVYSIVSRTRYHGIPAPLFDPTYFYNHGDVGPAGTFSGVWIDGFEESRFFPDVRAIATAPIPETASRIQMDDASVNLVHRFLAKPLTPGCSDVLAVSFKGNAVRPDGGIGWPGYIETIYVPTEILTVTPLQRIC